MAMSAFYGATTNLVLNVVLVSMFGIQGATVATVIASYIIYAVRNHAVLNELKIKSYKEIMFTWILLCVQGGIEIYVSCWAIEIILMVIMVWINWKTICKLCCSVGKLTCI